MFWERVSFEKRRSVIVDVQVFLMHTSPSTGRSGMRQTLKQSYYSVISSALFQRLSLYINSWHERLFLPLTFLVELKCSHTIAYDIIVCERSLYVRIRSQPLIYVRGTLSIRCVRFGYADIRRCTLCYPQRPNYFWTKFISVCERIEYTLLIR